MKPTNFFASVNLETPEKSSPEKPSPEKSSPEKPRFFKEFFGTHNLQESKCSKSAYSQTNLDNDKITTKDGFSKVSLLENLAFFSQKTKLLLLILILIFCCFEGQKVFAKQVQTSEANTDLSKDKPAKILTQEALTLADYLRQVRLKNLKIGAAEQFNESYELLQDKAKLVSAIKLYGFLESSFVEQNQALQFFRYSRVYNQNNRIGVSQNSEFGLKTNLYYSLNNIRYQGLNAANAPNPTLAKQNSQAVPTIELSMPIWQNRFGSSTRASKEAVFNENVAQKYAAKALSAQELVDAEKSYWLVVYSKKSLEIQSQALASAQKILDYVAKKQRMNLGEESDVLQAKAMLESKRLAVQQAQNFLKIAARNFNKKRNLVSDKVEENLADFELTKIQHLPIQEVRSDDRLDIKAQKAQADAAIAYAKIEEESNKPNLNLYGAYSVNQVEQNRLQAVGTTFQNNAPAGKVGIEFSMPLNFGLSSHVSLGASKKASAEKINYREKLQQQDLDWQNLIQNMQNLRQNLQLAMTIEKVQKLKLENERALLRQGRTSTYQILVFEQEFSNAKLNTQQIAQKLYELIAETKLYGG